MPSRRARPGRRRHPWRDHATYPHRRQRNRPFSYAASTQAHRGHRYSTGDVPYRGGLVAGTYAGGTGAGGGPAGGGADPGGGAYQPYWAGGTPPAGPATGVGAGDPDPREGRSTSWKRRPMYRT